MKLSIKKNWLKVIEFAVVGLATWLVGYAEISDFSLAQPDQAICTNSRIRRSETADHQRQFLLFLLKLCFQVLMALQQEESKSDPKSQAQQGFWFKFCFYILVVFSR
ncbi:MAG: hypothetical protein NW224_04805 [Leptolyngbyaceae cyanobacterium bins.302]|nr:hypothetical protein [Leptolyngbyaceae cyanobacterium bins.302]